MALLKRCIYNLFTITKLFHFSPKNQGPSVKTKVIQHTQIVQEMGNGYCEKGKKTRKENIDKTGWQRWREIMVKKRKEKWNEPQSRLAGRQMAWDDRVACQKQLFQATCPTPISRPKRPTAVMRCKRMKQERKQKMEKGAERLQKKKKKRKEKMSERASRIKAWFRERKWTEHLEQRQRRYRRKQLLWLVCLKASGRKARGLEPSS